MRKLVRKRIIVPVATIAVLAVAGVAVAYFTSSGTGSGTASVGTVADVTISPVTIATTLYPGGSSSVNFTINNSSDTAVKVGKVVADSPAITGLPDGCLAADFTFADVTVNDTVPAHGTLDGSGTLKMTNSNISQDACQGQSPVLHLKVDNSGI
jgi:hypothetical protein